MTLKVSRYDGGLYDHVLVRIDPSFDDRDVLAALRQWRDAGCPVAKLALELTGGSLFDLLAQPGYTHGAERLYRDGAC
jgi:hypothetical protein